MLQGHFTKLKKENVCEAQIVQLLRDAQGYILSRSVHQKQYTRTH